MAFGYKVHHDHRSYRGLKTEEELLTLGRVRHDLGSDQIGDVLYRDVTGDLTRLPVGPNGYVLVVNTGLPNWNPPNFVTAITLNTPGVIYNTPTNYFNLSGAWSGTLTLKPQSPNQAFLAPDGVAGTPSFRNIVLADLPSIPASKTTGFALVATTGVYNDLTGKPTIPQLTSITLSTDNIIYSTPNNFINTTGAWAGSLALKTQVAGTFLGGPVSGTAITPVFRVLDPLDIPGLAASKITSGTFVPARLGSGVADNTTVLYGDNVWRALPAGVGFANPMTTLGDIIYEDGTPAANRLAGNTTATKKFLTQTGTGALSAVPGWNTISTADVPLTSTQIGYGVSGALGSSNLLTFDVAGGQVLTLGTSGGTGRLVIGMGFQGVQFGSQIGGAMNASAGNAKGLWVLPSLNATANSDTLVGIEFDPSFSIGAFTSVNTISFRVKNRFNVDANGNIWNGSSVANPVPSSIFTVSTTQQGSVPMPSMTTSQKNLVSTPSEGVMVYDNIAHLPYFWNGSAWTAFNSGTSGTGTVTSVALTTPAWLTVSGSPVTGSGTLAVTASGGQTANQVLATPDVSTGAVGLRSLVTGDLPNAGVTYAKIQNVAADRLLGRISTSGTVQEIPLGGALQFSGGSLVTNIQTSTSIGGTGAPGSGLAVINNSSTQRVNVWKNGTLVSTRQTIDFIEGPGGIQIAVADGSLLDKASVTLSMNPANVLSTASVNTTDATTTTILTYAPVVNESGTLYVQMAAIDGSNNGTNGIRYAFYLRQTGGTTTVNATGNIVGGFIAAGLTGASWAIGVDGSNRIIVTVTGLAAHVIQWNLTYFITSAIFSS